MVSYLDKAGLSYLWNKITSLFYKKVDVDSISIYKTAVKYGYDKSIEAITGIIKGNCYVGVGSNVSDVYNVSACKLENFNANNFINLTSSDKYIFIVYPSNSDFSFNPTLNGLSIPTESIDTTTLQSYYIIKSKNTYVGTFKIKL